MDRQLRFNELMYQQRSSRAARWDLFVGNGDLRSVFSLAPVGTGTICQYRIYMRQGTQCM